MEVKELVEVKGAVAATLDVVVDEVVAGAVAQDVVVVA